MYGQPRTPRLEVLKKADEDFIKQASAAFRGSRRDASRAWVDQADRFFREGNLDYAMRRYNQAWLLDATNYRAFWGFGQVTLQKDKFTEAIGYFEQALSLCDDSEQRPALLSDTGTAYSFKAKYEASLTPAEKASIFAQANECFAKSTELNAHYGNAWKRWAMSLHREGRFADAWEKVKRARGAGITSFPTEFLDALSKELPEPK